MSFDSAMQRMQELGALVEPPQPPAAAATGTSTPAATAAFAAALQRASGQAALPATSQASVLPVLTTQDLPTGPYGVPSLGGFTSDPTSRTASRSTLAAQLEAAGLGPYLQSLGGLDGYGLEGSVGERIVSLAQREVGVRESPPGSNDSTRISQYRTATAGAADTPGPWCAYFVSWLARQAGAPVGTNGQGTGYVPTLESWGKQTGRWRDAGSTPQAGDVVTFDWNGGVADHTGIVERVDADGTIHTIEGNSGNAVTRHTYALDSSSISGFIHLG